MTWENRWNQGHTPWDAGASPPVLAELLASGSLPAGRALVPGCGTGYDVMSLSSPERFVVGLDLAPAVAPHFEALRRSCGVRAEHVKLVIDDFFTFEPTHPFDLIWDYMFLCALDPSRRSRWAERNRELLVEGGTLATLLFPVDADRPPDQGPPFALDPEEVTALLEPHFARTELRQVQHSHPARAGREWLASWRRRA